MRTYFIWVRKWEIKVEISAGHICHKQNVVYKFPRHFLTQYFMPLHWITPHEREWKTVLENRIINCAHLYFRSILLLERWGGEQSIINWLTGHQIYRQLFFVETGINWNRVAIPASYSSFYLMRSPSKLGRRFGLAGCQRCFASNYGTRQSFLILKRIAFAKSLCVCPIHCFFLILRSRVSTCSKVSRHFSDAFYNLSYQWRLLSLNSVWAVLFFRRFFGISKQILAEILS